MKRTVIIITGGVIVSLAVYLQVRHAKPVSAAPEQGKAPSSATSMVAVGTNRAQAGTNPLTKVPKTPPRLGAIYGLSGETFDQRRKAIQALTPPLTEEELKAAFEFLRTQGGSDVRSEHVLKDEMMTLLEKQKPPLANFVGEMSALYHDRSLDDVTRIYAIQHLVTGCLDDTNRYASDRQELHDTLWEAIGETDTGAAGTALLGLHRLQSTDSAIDGNRVDEVALKLASDTSCGQLARITAIQVCAERRLPDILPVAVQLALQGDSITIRASAIAAIGAVGGSPEMNVLRELEKQNEPALRPALTAALKQLGARAEKINNG